MTAPAPAAGPGPGAGAAAPHLSICVATFRRAGFIGETLRCILSQLPAGVEVVVVDGASPDGTPEVVAPLAAAHPALRYFREPVNSGVDADYDKAVGYARGEHCWLMTDDDLLAPGAVARVLEALAGGPDLVVVNAETRTPDLARVIDERLVPLRQDRDYGPGQHEALLRDAGRYLSFIGGVVVRRAAWLARDRASYLGSVFVHVGVILQEPPLPRARLVAEPLVRIRWGNAMWTPRAFEIWMFKWPGLIWGFGHYPEAARAAVVRREPWRSLRQLGLFRAQGAYGPDQYRAFLAGRGGLAWRLAARAIAAVPLGLANVAVALYVLLLGRSYRREAWDMAHGPHATWVARVAAGLLGL